MIILVLIVIAAIIVIIWALSKLKTGVQMYDEVHDLQKSMFADAAAKAGKINPSEAVETPKKEASVVGSAVVGGVIAGPAGAVVGAISAADKNNRANNDK